MSTSHEFLAAMSLNTMHRMLGGSRRSFSAITRLGTSVSPRLSEAVVHAGTVIPSCFL
jgi:hypothetical protein